MSSLVFKEQLFSIVDQVLQQEELLIRCLEAEKDALLLADIPLIQECSGTKQKIIDRLSQLESRRQALIGTRKMRELVEEDSAVLDRLSREELRAKWEALRQKVALAVEKNEANQKLLASSIKHIENMKKNVLGETIPKSNTYSSSGNKVAGSNQSGARRISKEV